MVKQQESNDKFNMTDIDNDGCNDNNDNNEYQNDQKKYKYIEFWVNYTNFPPVFGQCLKENISFVKVFPYMIR